MGDFIRQRQAQFCHADQNAVFIDGGLIDQLLFPMLFGGVDVWFRIYIEAAEFLLGRGGWQSKRSWPIRSWPP